MKILTTIVLVVFSFALKAQENVLFYPGYMEVKVTSEATGYKLEIEKIELPISEDNVIFIITLENEKGQQLFFLETDNLITHLKFCKGRLVVTAYAVNDNDPVIGLCPIGVYTQKLTK